MKKEIDNTLLSLFRKYNNNKDSLTKDELLIIEQNKPLFKEHIKEYQNIKDKLYIYLTDSNKEGLLNTLEEIKNIDHFKSSIEWIDSIKEAIYKEKDLNINSKLNIIENSRKKNIKNGIESIINWMNEYIGYFENVSNEFKKETTDVDTSDIWEINNIWNEIRKINTLLNGEKYDVEDLIENIEDKELKKNLQLKINELKLNNTFLEQLKNSIYKTNKLSDEDRKSLEFFDNEDIYSNLNLLLSEKWISKKITSNIDLLEISDKYKVIFQEDDVLNELQKIKEERIKRSNLKSLELYSKYNNELPSETKDLYNEFVVLKFKNTLDKDYLNKKKDNLLSKMKELLVRNLEIDVEDDLKIDELYSKEEININIWNFKKTLLERGIDAKNKTIKEVVDSINKIKENKFVTWINEWLTTTRSILNWDFLPNEKVEEYFDKVWSLSKKIMLTKWIWYILNLSLIYFNIYEFIVWVFDKIYKWISSNSWFVVQIIFIVVSIFLFLLTLATGWDSFLFKSIYNSNVFLPVDLNIDNLLEYSSEFTKTGIYLTTNFFTGFFTIMMGSLMLFTLMMIVLRWLTISWIDVIDISSGKINEGVSSNVEWVNLKNEKIKLVWNIITFIILVMLNFFLLK